MRRMKLVGLSIIAVLALSAFAVAPAFAGGLENPEWYVGSALLGAGESSTITAEAATTQKLKATGIEIDCTNVALVSGAKLIGGLPGTDSEQLIYTGCTVSGHTETCVAKSKGAANGEIETAALSSKLAFASQAAAEAKKASSNGSVTVFTPVSGTTFVEIELTGTCGFVPSSSKVTGSVIVTNLQTGEGSAATATTQEISAVNAHEYFVNPGAESKTASLKAFGLAASYEGNSKVKDTSAFSVEG